MNEYTFILLNPDFYAVRYLTVDCLDDDGAMTLAQFIARRTHVEVWHHARYVGELQARKPVEPDMGAFIDDAAPLPRRLSRVAKARKIAAMALAG